MAMARRTDLMAVIMAARVMVYLLNIKIMVMTMGRKGLESMAVVMRVTEGSQLVTASA